MILLVKEIKELVKLLLFSKPYECKDVELCSMNYFPFKGYKYMMWCGKMIYRIDSPIDFSNNEIFEKNKNHERIHLSQAKFVGSWLKYYYKYLIEWIKGNPLFPPFVSAYYTIPFEMEAYANEDDYSYYQNYNGEYLHCYTINDRKKQFKKYNNLYDWKKYLKSINKIK